MPQKQPSTAERGHSFGRAEQPDRAALARLVRSITRCGGRRVNARATTAPSSTRRREVRTRAARGDRHHTGREGSRLRTPRIVRSCVEKRITDFFTAKATAVMTNVAGPPKPVSFAGVPVAGVVSCPTFRRYAHRLVNL
ncbi:MAG: WS/DGAT domain-containing protein, partial [Solirubrobacteraceae bacterium]